jgi:hypothetical protein
MSHAFHLQLSKIHKSLYKTINNLQGNYTSSYCCKQTLKITLQLKRAKYMPNIKNYKKALGMGFNKRANDVMPVRNVTISLQL